VAALSVVWLIGGLALLVVGAEALVRGAARLAGALGLSPIVIGLTVVAFGTSAPELAVSVDGALSGASDVAIGNVVGSNIFNVLVILGLSAAAGRLVVHRRIVRLDVPLVIASTALVWVLALDGRIGRGDGVVLAGAVLAYTTWLVVASRREERVTSDEFDVAFHVDAAGARRAWPRSVLLVLVGLALLVVGADRLVTGAVEIAAALGVSDLVIGLTVVAAGTSLPELATSVVAARRGQRDIAVGNVIGSNLFNLLAVLGGAALVAPSGLTVSRAVLAFDLPVAFIVVVIALPALAFGLTVERWEGWLLLGGYAAYLGAIVVTARSGADPATLRTPVIASLALVGLVLVVVGWSQARGGTGRFRPRPPSASATSS